MTTALPPHFVDLVQDALLKSFWTKKGLKRFLRRSHISDNYLAQLDNSETKREWLDRLFPKLEKSDRGSALIQQIAQSLADQTTFPDLQNWENSEQKIRDAKEAVTRLQQYIHKKNQHKRQREQQHSVKETARKARESYLASQQTLESLRTRLDQLATRIGTQKAGYDFQDWFYELMDFFEIQNRKPYIDPNGRQIDGSITLDGTTYLCELKFSGDPTPPKEISDLRDKVRTKADNTMAIMVAISGYGDGSKSTASGDGTPLLLLDASHLYCSLTAVIAFDEMIKRLRRHSSQTGEAYLPPTRFGS